MSVARDDGFGKLGSAVLITAAVALVPIGYWVYCRLGNVDRLVTSGSAYGFTIGQSKEEVYAKLKRERGAQRFLTVEGHRLVLSARLRATSRVVGFTERDFEAFSRSDEWILFADASDSFFSTIDLKFTDGRLQAIHRRHRPCEEL